MADKRKPRAKPVAPRPRSERPKPRPPEELGIEDDFLDDVGKEIDDVIHAPTEEHSPPTGAIELDGTVKKPAKPKPKASAQPKAAAKPKGTLKPAAAPKPVNPGDTDPAVFDAFAEAEEPADEEELDEDLEDEEFDEDDELAAEGDEDFDDEYDDEYDDEEEEEADQPTGVLAAVTGRLPRLPGRGGGGGGGNSGGRGGRGGDGEEPRLGPPKRRFPIWARFIAGSFAVVASVAAATAASLLLYLGDIAEALGHNEELGALTAKLPEPQGGPQTIMIVGSDKRPEEIEAGQNGRSDTTILLRLDPDRNAISLFSIPRDLIVEIPGHGSDLFNAAYSLGGPELTLDTVKALTGLEVNHVVNINFRGFAKAVQAIGCVYVDVDRRYFHSNEGLAAADQYAEIDVRPGYQRLCGFKALEYVRYRHGDNDVVRSARQQDFLREARARVPADKLFSDRHDLIKIFTDYTTSDINDVGTMLEVMKLIIAAREQPVKEVHFEGEIGNRVTTTPAQIKTAVDQFLGIKGTTGPRGSSTAAEGGATPAPEVPPAPTVSPKEAKAAPKAVPAPAATPEPPKLSKSAQGLEGGTFGRKLAFRVRRRNQLMPIYYPTTVVAGSEYAAAPRAYNLQDHSLSPDETFSYKFTLKTADSQYYGLQGTRWKDAPILDEPHETKEIGDRTYNLYYDNDRLRMVSWETDEAVYWISNSLLQGLTADQMIAIARGATLLEPPVAAPAKG